MYLYNNSFLWVAIICACFVIVCETQHDIMDGNKVSVSSWVWTYVSLMGRAITTKREKNNGKWYFAS